MCLWICARREETMLDQWRMHLRYIHTTVWSACKKTSLQQQATPLHIQTIKSSQTLANEYCYASCWINLYKGFCHNNQARNSPEISLPFAWILASSFARYLREVQSQQKYSPRKYSSLSSNTKFTRSSKPRRVPCISRPPKHLTRTTKSIILVSSRMDSFLALAWPLMLIACCYGCY